jgi:hypothetical protein
MIQGFDVPIALFIFKRYETVLRIMDVIRKIKPHRLYLIGDGPRNQEENNDIIIAREKIEASIDWDCEVIKNYALKNRGVYENIAGGAKWVLKQEPYAIFLEDDNLPERTFFEFCSEMLNMYEYDERILWICGTNYLEKYSPADGSDYVFTKHLMPCGWASWASKFERCYDGELNIFRDPHLIKKIKKSYLNKALYRQQISSAKYELYRKSKGLKFASWDFQMALSIRANDMYGICPRNNQIKNIGVDSLSTHGGTSFSNEMTRRFCGIESYALEFPLKHPNKVVIDNKFEQKVGKIILFPIRLRMKDKIATIIKILFGLSRYDKFNLENIKRVRKND